MADIVLVRHEDAPKILKAFREQRLLKQRHPDAECVYRGIDNLPCAIGVLLSDEEAERLPYGDTIEYSIQQGLVDADDPEWFTLVQEAHDACDWVSLENLLTEPNAPSQTKQD